MKKGFYTIMSAQFFSSLADNALLVAAIELLKTGGAPSWHIPALTPMFALFYVILAPVVGAFADAEAARETRQKVERLGLKTYTQVAQTSAGSRIRVRVGPFATREDAEAALAKAKAAGLAAVVLTL